MIEKAERPKTVTGARGTTRARLWVVSLVLGLLACGGEPEPGGRVLLVGIDGASPRIVRPLLEQGRLPNLARIAEQGVSGPLKSLHPLLSPRVWTTVATGKTPKRHGIENWVTPVRDGQQRLYLSSDRKVHALWNIASDAGRSVAMVNWLVTYPPEPIRGVMITDHALPGASEGKKFMRNLFAEAPASDDDASLGEGSGPVTWPDSWIPRVAAAAEAEGALTPIGDPFVTATLPSWVLRDKLSAYYRQDETLARIALEVEAETRPDVMMVLFQGIDRSSHMLWGMVEPAELYPESLHPSAAEREGGLEALRRYYEYSDALIGLLVERFGPDDLIMVVSDHGFEAGVTWKIMTGTHNSPKAEDGVLFARGRRIRHGEAEGVSVTDVTPTILTWLGLPVGQDMDGEPAAFLDARARTVATYETKPIPRLATGPSGAEETYIEQLRELGYVE